MTNLRKFAIGIGSVLLILFIVWLVTGEEETKKETLTTKVKKGPFKVTVTTTGELKAKKSQKIRGPSGLRKAGIWRVNITDIIPEGSHVDSGDYIATLDRKEISEKLKEVKNQLQKAQSKYTQTQLDTSLTLRGKREKLADLKIAKEQKEIELEQSQFEPPAIQRQKEIELQKAKRAYRVAKRNYQIQKRKAAAKMQEVAANLTQKENKLEDLKELMAKFRVKAPQSGMLIYEEKGSGKKKEGSSISAWNPVVAKLPDLSVMISETYVNEVEISKVAKGQKVKIGIDAFPEKSYTGRVVNVANVGETIPKTDAKVFNVKIELNQTDTLLRPSMTTSNKIITNRLKSAVYVPLESLHGNDTTNFVFKKSGFGVVKQEVVPGIRNADQVVIKEGLKPESVVYLTVPENAGDMAIEPLETTNDQ